MLVKRSSDLPTEGAAPNPKKMVGKMKVQGIICGDYLVSQNTE